MIINSSLRALRISGLVDVEIAKMIRKFSFVVVAMLFVTLLASTGWSQEAGQRTFSTPQEASKALYEAVKAGDTQTVLAILGSSAEGIIHSGDAVQDKKNTDLFLNRYQQMNRIGRQADGSRVLYLGAGNWPFPIPLVQKAGKWYFDTPAGMQEILFRRIGKNELAALRVLNALVDAQNEYYSGTHDGETHVYAARFLSTPGKQDGLYWKTAEGEPESPIGPLVAHATREGYAKSDKPEPFHGYYYRMLKSQGANAPGGAKPYLADGKMTGFAFIAYPAEYRNSGVMTFLVSTDGVIYEKDLGTDTATAAPAITSFNPDKTWTQVPSDEGDVDSSSH